jgi:hypothetical protein
MSDIEILIERDALASGAERRFCPARSVGSAPPQSDRQRESMSSEEARSGIALLRGQMGEAACPSGAHNAMSRPVVHRAGYFLGAAPMPWGPAIIPCWSIMVCIIICIMSIRFCIICICAPASAGLPF